MNRYRHHLIALLLGLGLYGSAFGQDSLRVIPPLEQARHAITLDIAGNTPLIGVGYRNQIIRFSNAQHSYSGGLELSAGLGYIPSICFFACSKSGVSTYHSLLLLFGRKVQAEIGYSGMLISKYLPGAIVGLRYAPENWLLRLYLNRFVHGTIPGVSVGLRF